jgi:hypothetical protein
LLCDEVAFEKNNLNRDKIRGKKIDVNELGEFIKEVDLFIVH